MVPLMKILELTSFPRMADVFHIRRLPLYDIKSCNDSDRNIELKANPVITFDHS